MTLHKILFVCTGNLCRSPTAEGIARGLAEQQGVDHLFKFDSAGTHTYHVGEPPDARAVAAARLRGFDLSALRARRLTSFDFIHFDHLLAMDHHHLETLQRICPTPHRKKLGLFLDFSKRFDTDEVPDPHRGGTRGFDYVAELAEYAAIKLIRRLTPK
jgi:protein-tyrosine phosphatase